MKALYVLIFLFIVSCSGKVNKQCKEVIIQDYLVEIKFSSFFDCGVFKKIILSNKGYGFFQDLSFCKAYTLYTINVKGACEDRIISDTLSRTLSQAQSDSVFTLANNFMKSYTLDNRVLDCNEGRPSVLDGANLEVRLCLENRCLTGSYDHYGEFKNISDDLNKLMAYVK